MLRMTVWFLACVWGIGALVIVAMTTILSFTKHEVSAITECALFAWAVERISERVNEK